METVKANPSTKSLDERITEMKLYITMLTVASVVSAINAVWWFLTSLPRLQLGHVQIEDTFVPSLFVITVALLMHLRLRFTELMFNKLGLDE